MSQGLPRLSRRSVRAPCQVVRERDFRLVGRHIVDLSTDGMLVLTDTPVLTGTSVICALKMPFGSTKWLDAEAIVWIDSEPGKAFGFKLRWEGTGDDVFPGDPNSAAAKSMLDLLRSVFNDDNPVRIDYIRTGLRNGRIIRVAGLP